MQPQSVQPFQAICGGCAAADTGTAATQPNATSVPSNALADLFRGEAVEEAIASGALQVVLLADVVIGVQLGQVVGNDDALGVLPGTFADAVARVDRAGALGAQIGVPGLGAGARGCTKQLAELVRAGDAAEIGALAGAGA